MEAIRNYRTHPHLVIGTHHIPTWTTPLLLIFVVAVLVPGTSLLGHLCGLAVGYICMSTFVPSSQALQSANNNGLKGGLGYLKWLSPPEKALRWIETKFNLLAWLPHYVSVDQKTFGRFGVLPISHAPASTPPIALVGAGQRLG